MTKYLQKLEKKEDMTEVLKLCNKEEYDIALYVIIELMYCTV